MKLLALFLLVARLGIPGIYSDNMVVQQKSTLQIPGSALPGTKVTAEASWGRTASAVAAADSSFTLRLRTPRAGGPFCITIRAGEESLTLSNVLSGELWLCSGQSNMEMPVQGWGNIIDHEAVVADAANHPDVRVLRVRRQADYSPIANPELADGGWCVSDSACIAEFSAAGYFFALELNKALGVPVGMIGSSWGGSTCEAWTAPAALAEMQEYNYLGGLLRKDGELDGAAYKSYCYHRYDKFGFAGLGADPAVYSEDWTSCDMPMPFSRQGLEDLNGEVWYQYRFDLPAGPAGKRATLSLGIIDTQDETYVNGTLVGKTDSYVMERKYALDPALLRESGNVISVKVIDNYGEGGFLSAAEELYLELDGKRISLAGEWKMAIAVDYTLVSNDPDHIPPTNGTPAFMYNAMICPFHLMPVRGFLWYQGCSNVGRDAEYAQMFPRLVKSWRKLWKSPRKPFYFVQLASYLAARDVQPDSEWAALRHAQTSALKLKNTGMAVTTDIGNADDIHPKNKQEVGRRLALLALHDVYGRNCICRAPAPTKAKASGSTVKLRFNGEVVLPDTKGWVVGTADGSYHVVTDVRSDGKCVVINAEGLGTVTEVLYNWADYGQGLMACSASGLPVAPFRIPLR